MAVLLVMLDHLNLPIGTFAGPVGVTLFFVLSGYLITNVINLHLCNGTFTLFGFYVRRARRLLPALLVFLLAATAIRVAMGPAGGWWDQSWPGLAYAANFKVISDGWESMGFLNHLWSLSVEEHFYLLWPALLLAIPNRHLSRFLMALLLVAAAWKGYLLATVSNWDRVYLGSDTNAFALLVGSFLAVDDSPKLLRRSGHVALVATLALSLLPAGLTASALLSFAGVIGCGVLVKSASQGLPMLEGRLLCWLGTISYALYLWQGMFLQVLDDRVLGFAASLGIAALSWRVVEARWLQDRLSSRTLVPIVRNTVVTAPPR
jgi:peptidoglycan/LPS O-acetylase OafA/YrhL